MRKQCSVLINSVMAAVMTLLLTACGGGGGGGDSTGTASLSLTDAPVDGAMEVVVSIDGVDLLPGGGNRIMFYLADTTGTCEVVTTPDPGHPCQVNLMDYTGTDRVTLLDTVTLPAGKYSWVRLVLNNNPGYIILLDGRQYNLQVPSGAETGLKLNGGFKVAAGNYTDYTIDFDLRKSVHDPEGSADYILRPTLRMVDNLEVGTLSGNVDPNYFAGGACTGAIYIFDADTPGAPDDEDGVDDPITTAMVPNDGVYGYTVGFLAEGDYLVAFTCNAAADDPGIDDAGIAFQSQATVHITAGQNTVQNF
jgi:hypothetical protein